jgi:hypothetical protein
MNNTKNNLTAKLATAKKSLRPQSQRLALEPRIVFDAVLPVMGAEVIEHISEPVTHIAEQDAPHIEAPALTNHPNEQENTADNSTAETAANDRPLIDGTLAPTNLTSHEIIFIDAIVADLQQYITDHPNADVVLLDSTKDALDQIAATLSGRTDISAIHI